MLNNGKDTLNYFQNQKNIKHNINSDNSFNTISPNNISYNNSGFVTNSMKFFRNMKSDYPIKLINNNMKNKETLRYNKK